MSTEDGKQVELTIRYQDYCDREAFYHLFVGALLIPSVIPRIMAIGFSMNHSFTRDGQPKIACTHIPPHRILDIRWEADDTSEGERI